MQVVQDKSYTIANNSNHQTPETQTGVLESLDRNKIISRVVGLCFYGAMAEFTMQMVTAELLGAYCPSDFDVYGMRMRMTKAETLSSLVIFGATGAVALKLEASLALKTSQKLESLLDHYFPSSKASEPEQEQSALSSKGWSIKGFLSNNVEYFSYIIMATPTVATLSYANICSSIGPAISLRQATWIAGAATLIESKLASGLGAATRYVLDTLFPTKE